ncbi:MAG TPA: lytic transglycosylase domain-containing protein [Verrucomicrobiae bacterium]|jgi:membrane-bound lytic murein transglycosylase D
MWHALFRQRFNLLLALTFGFALLSPFLQVCAQPEQLSADELLKSVQDWMQENVDDTVWDALGLDQNRVREFMTEMEVRLHGTNPYDLGHLEQTAIQLLPVLKKFEETQPYAEWLETHLDYLSTANELRRQVKPATNSLLPAPPLQLQRTIWVHQLERRPMPQQAQKIIPRLKTIFAAQNVPSELVWLAEIESSFNASAKSPAGAAGMFQLMPVTAKRFNLSLWPHDERLDLDKSAQAAAHYLRILHQRFGDWRLALAAYNAGEQRVQNLLKQDKAPAYDRIAYRLPAETQMYVPKFEALLLRREGKRMSDLN